MRVFAYSIRAAVELMFLAHYKTDVEPGADASFRSREDFGGVSVFNKQDHRYDKAIVF